MTATLARERTSGTPSANRSQYGGTGHQPRPTRLGAYVAAIRPATLWAAVVPVWVGTALAIADGVFAAGAALAALLGAVFIQIGTNLFNDYADFKSGADTDERLGPKRATQQGWLRPRAVLMATSACLVVASVAGIYLTWVAGWPILVVGIVSILSGLAYTGGPYPLGYKGLGDLFVFVFFGLVAVAGTYFVQAQTVSSNALIAGAALGFLCTAILVVNNLRDRHTDAKVNKNTLAVRFGARFVRWEYTLVVLAAFALTTAVAVLSGKLGWLLPLLLVPLGVSEIRAVWRTDGIALNPHLGRAARLELLFGALLGVGFLL